VDLPTFGSPTIPHLKPMALYTCSGWIFVAHAYEV
jgi:hypothetical protein